MDPRISAYLDRKPSLSLAGFPVRGIEIRPSGHHRDAPWKRIAITRIGHAVLATGLPRIVDVIRPVIRNMSV